MLFRHLIPIIILFTLAQPGLTQGVLITDDASSSPDASAALELKSVSKGFLPPRLTTTQMKQVANPVSGMLVYNSSVMMPMIYNGTEWTDMTGSIPYETLEVGDYYQGGIIFHLDGAGGGWIAAPSDLEDGFSTTFLWGCLGISTNAVSDSDGAANADSILINCSETTNSAYLTDQYSNDGYNDWFVPAPDQIDSMYTHKSAIGGFSEEIYWTSKEANSSGAAAFDLSSGTLYSAVFKEIAYRVRPMREF